MFIKILIAIIVGASIGLIIDYVCKKKIIKEVPTEERIDVLRKYKSYDIGKKSRKYSNRFVLGNKMPKILLKYDYMMYCNRKFDNKDDIVFSMLDFVCDNFKHDGHTPILGRHSLVGVIRGYEKMDSKTNCRGLSLILAEVLRMNGIKARHITCKPYEEPFEDCHVVVDCIMPSGKRVMLDPTYRLYLVDENGEYVSLERFREGIIEGTKFYPNVNSSYNGGTFSYDDYKEYMTKNLVRFSTNYILDDSMPDSRLSEIELIPKGYNVNGYVKRVKYICDPELFWNM